MRIYVRDGQILVKTQYSIKELKQREKWHAVAIVGRMHDSKPPFIYLTLAYVEIGFYGSFT